MIPKKFKKVFDEIVAFDWVQLRSNEAKTNYFAKLNQLLNEPTLLSDIFELDLYLEDYKKLMGLVYEMLEETNKLSFDAIKDKGLAEKDYNNSWAIITLDEDDYIKDGLGLKYTDFEKNIDKISSGFYDYFEQKWIISKDEMKQFLKNLQSIVSFTYNPNVISRKEFIVKPQFWVNDLMPNNLLATYATAPNKFIPDYTQLMKFSKVVDKFTDSLKLLIKQKLINKMGWIDGVDTKEMQEKIIKDMGAQVDYYNGLSFNYNLNVQASSSSKPGAKVNFGYKAMGLPFMLDGRVCEYYAKDVNFGDLRTKQTKEWLLYIIDTTKNTLISRGVLRRKKNLFIKKLDVKKFPEITEQEKYKGIYTEKEIWKLKS